MELISHPFIVWMLNSKWKKFARTHFYMHVLYYTVDICVLTTLVMYARYGHHILEITPVEKGQGYYQPILAPNLWEGWDELHCEDNPTDADPDDIHGFRCERHVVR